MLLSSLIMVPKTGIAVVSSLDLHKKKHCKRCFHVSRTFNIDLSSTALIMGKYAAMSPNHFLFWFYLSIILISAGIELYEMIDGYAEHAQDIVMFPDEEPAEMFFIPDHNLRAIFQCYNRLRNGIEYWTTQSRLLEFNSHQLHSFLEQLNVGIEGLNIIHARLTHILDLDNPMYNISYEMINYLAEDLSIIIQDLYGLKLYIIQILDAIEFAVI